MSAASKQRVGAFILGGFLLFAVGLFMIGDRRQIFSDNITLYTEFRNLAGLQNGATVRVAGMAAGEVTAIGFPPGPDQEFRVEFRVLDSLMPVIRGDSITSIQIDGIVGNKFLQVEPGSSEAAGVDAGDTLPSEEPFEFADLMEEARAIVATAGSAIEQVQGDLETVVQNINDVAHEAEGLIADVRPEFQTIATSASSISETADTLLTGVREGKGTVGKLFRDEEMYVDIRATMDDFKAIAANAKKVSDGAATLLQQAQEKELMADVSATAKDIREIAGQAKEALAGFDDGGGPGEPGLLTELRTTLTNANEMMADFSENSEALKRNFFLRGFFKKRGFYDLDQIAVDEYKQGEMAPGYEVGRKWLHEQTLFEGEDGNETLSEVGRKAVALAVGDFLQGSRSDPILVEGYAAAETEAEAFSISQQRAAVVRQHLIEEFDLDPNYVGVMPMGEVASKAQNDKPWDGVALVQFVDKKKMKELEKERKRAG